MSDEIRSELAEIILRHQRIPMFNDERGQRCVGCDHLHGATDGPNSPRHVDHIADLLAEYVARHRAEAAAEADGRWVERLAALCDDDWLRQRDRAMDLTDTRTHGWVRRGSSAWERAAHQVRELLNEFVNYEDEYTNTHASYLRWMQTGRDRAKAERGGS